MAKKKEDPPKPGAPAWTATFGVLMNLLLCFFVLLFSMSTIDAAKYQEIVNSFAETFSIFQAGGNSIGDGVMISNGVSQLNELSTYFDSMGLTSEGERDNEEANNNSDSSAQDSENKGDPAELKEELEQAQLEASEKLAEQIEEYVSQENLDHEIDIDFTSQYVLLTMNGALLFDSGRAEIKSEAEPLVDKIGNILMRYAESTIEIEGHTDNVPIHNANFADNDELSSARAMSVFHYLIDNTMLDPSVIKHTGRGEYIPIADNSTPEGRAKNRRVEVKIYNELSDAS
ncbi:MAG: OmpA family protein [Lachnospiraceae bacterium]|nr:OmpA family protein [Lachnospiraceae bacterium]